MTMPSPVPYTELPLDGLDAERIEAFWLYIAEGPAAQKVLPDGRASLLVRFRVDADGETISNPRIIVAGPTLAVHELPMVDGTGSLGVRFRLGWAGACLGVSPRALRDHVLVQDRAEALAAVVEHAATLKSVPTLSALKTALIEVTQALTSRAVVSDGQLLAVRAVHLLHQSHGRPDLKLLCQQLGVPERRLRHEVLEAVGVPLRSLASIARFHRAVGLLRLPGATLGEVAFDAGYSDQAHMNREFRRLGGFTPTTPEAACC